MTERIRLVLQLDAFEVWRVRGRLRPAPAAPRCRWQPGSALSRLHVALEWTRARRVAVSRARSVARWHRTFNAALRGMTASSLASAARKASAVRCLLLGRRSLHEFADAVAMARRLLHNAAAEMAVCRMCRGWRRWRRAVLVGLTGRLLGAAVRGWRLKLALARWSAVRATRAQSACLWRQADSWRFRAAAAVALLRLTRLLLGEHAARLHRSRALGQRVRVALHRWASAAALARVIGASHLKLTQSHLALRRGHSLVQTMGAWRVMAAQSAERRGIRRVSGQARDTFAGWRLAAAWEQWQAWREACVRARALRRQSLRAGRRARGFSIEAMRALGSRGAMAATRRRHGHFANGSECSECGDEFSGERSDNDSWSDYSFGSPGLSMSPTGVRGGAWGGSDGRGQLGEEQPACRLPPASYRTPPTWRAALRESRDESTGASDGEGAAGELQAAASRMWERDVAAAVEKPAESEEREGASPTAAVQMVATRMWAGAERAAERVAAAVVADAARTAAEARLAAREAARREAASRLQAQEAAMRASLHEQERRRAEAASAELAGARRRAAAEREAARRRAVEAWGQRSARKDEARELRRQAVVELSAELPALTEHRAPSSRRLQPQPPRSRAQSWAQSSSPRRGEAPPWHGPRPSHRPSPRARARSLSLLPQPRVQTPPAYSYRSDALASPYGTRLQPREGSAPLRSLILRAGEANARHAGTTPPPPRPRVTPESRSTREAPPSVPQPSSSLPPPPTASSSLSSSPPPSPPPPPPPSASDAMAGWAGLIQRDAARAEERKRLHGLIERACLICAAAPPIPIRIPPVPQARRRGRRWPVEPEWGQRSAPPHADRDRVGIPMYVGTVSDPRDPRVVRAFPTTAFGLFRARRSNGPGDADGKLTGAPARLARLCRCLSKRPD